MADAVKEPLPETSTDTDVTTGRQSIDLEVSPAGSSDGEGAERTTREKLKKTSIAGLQQASANRTSETGDHPLSVSVTAESLEHDGATTGGRGRPAKKRSFDEIQGKESTETDSTLAQAPLPKSGHHKRMRSRDISSGEHLAPKSEAEVASPLQEESDIEAQRSPGGAGVLIEHTDNHKSSTAVNGAAPESVEQLTADAQTMSPERDSSLQAPSSGFANISSASPFGNSNISKTASSTTGSAAEPKPASSSAFASSGLSAFASTDKSPFSSAGSTAKSGFGGGFGSTRKGFGGTSSFAGSNPSGFASSGGFGSTSGLGSSTGFGSTLKPIGGLSGFGTSSTSTFGSGKALGQMKKDDEHEDNEHDEEEKEDDDVAQDDDRRQDSRFVEQDVETGEEQEETIFSCRAKLYHFDKEWKERGVGTFKVNVRYEETKLPTTDQDEDDEEAANGAFTQTQRRGRLIMRTDGVHKVILNTPVFKGMNVGTQEGEEPTGKTMFLQGLEDGKPRGFQVKIGKEEVMKDLYHRIRELQADLD